MPAEETTPDMLSQIAQKHGFGADAAQTAFAALRAGQGRQAQFNHPDLGGLGQWSSGGMLMIGDMLNSELKARVAALFSDLSTLPQPSGEQATTTQNSLSSHGGRWPKELGTPSSTGSQNAMHYAVFTQTRRLAVERDGTMTIYDTGNHRISGVGQQQSGSQSLRLTSQIGSVDIADLPVVTPSDAPERPRQSEVQDTAPIAARGKEQGHEAVIAKIESLHGLLQKGIISQEEFDEKKKELLSRI